MTDCVCCEIVAGRSPVSTFNVGVSAPPAAVSHTSRMRRSLVAVCALLPFAASVARAQEASSPPTTRPRPGTPAQGMETRAATETLLDRLVGEWRMVGHVRGKPVTYTLAASRVLGGRYVELHMTDVQRPPQYEARVFVGADTAPGRVIVHWLDSFGAAASIPHGTGSVAGDTLRFEFAYRSGAFRDTFVYRAASRSWSMRLEAADGRGGWRPFAEYVATEPKR